MDLVDVMDGIATRLETIADLNVYAYPSHNPAAPAAVVTFPEEFEYDLTMGRGSDQAVFPVHVLVSMVSDRSARDQLADYMSGDGVSSVKRAIELDPTLAGAADSTRVASVSVSVMTVGAVDLLAATFQIDVVG